MGFEKIKTLTNGSQLIDIVPQVTANKNAIAGISASPKGVYATLTALQTAFPTGNSNIYVVAADGKWYYWNSSAWTAGGIYQAASISSRSIKNYHTNFIKNDINLLDINSDEVVVDKYFGPTGIKESLTGARISNKMLVAPGDVIKFYRDSLFSNQYGIFVDESDNLVGNISTMATDFTVVNGICQFTVPSNSNIKYIYYNYRQVNGSAIMVVKNIDYPTVYVPFKQKFDDSFVFDFNKLYNVPALTNTENVAEYIENNVIDYSVLFKNAICIGDSLTQGYYSAELGNLPYNYPYCIGQMTKWNVDNHGHSGATAISFWNSYMINDYSSYDLCIILLGQNQGLTDTLEADTTISEGQTYLNYAATNTGSYCKIIEKIKESNPDINIFLCKTLQNYDDKNISTNVVIDKIGAKYSLPVLDLYNDCIMTKANGNIYRPIDDIHYGKIGYLTLAHTILTLIKKHISNNLVNYKL